MKRHRIDDIELSSLIDEGLSQAAVAKRLGVSRQAVNFRLQELRGKTTKAIVAKKVDQVVEQKLDAVQQVKKINDYANELLDLLMRWNRGDEGALQVLESQVQTRKVRVGDEEFDVNEFKFKDPRELALKAMAEIRGQLKLQLEIFQTLYDMQAVQEFQEEILKVIGEVDQGIRNEIISRLNKRRAVRQVVRFGESTVL